MKKLVLVVLTVLATVAAKAQEIKWMSLNDAIAAQKKDPKPVFMDVYTEWCGPCKELDRSTFHDKEVVAYINANYYAVKFNAEGNTAVNYKGKKYSNPNFVEGRKGRNAVHEFTRFLSISAYPTMIVLDKDDNIINTIEGLLPAKQLLDALKE